METLIPMKRSNVVFFSIFITLLFCQSTVFAGIESGPITEIDDSSFIIDKSKEVNSINKIGATSSVTLVYTPTSISVQPIYAKAGASVNAVVVRGAPINTSSWITLFYTTGTSKQYITSTVVPTNTSSITIPISTINGNTTTTGSIPDIATSLGIGKYQLVAYESSVKIDNNTKIGQLFALVDPVGGVDFKTANLTVIDPINRFGDTDSLFGITTLDALLALQDETGIVRLRELQFIRADVNGDAKANSADASLILVAAINPSFCFPISPCAPTSKMVFASSARFELGAPISDKNETRIPLRAFADTEIKSLSLYTSLAPGLDFVHALPKEWLISENYKNTYRLASAGLDGLTSSEIGYFKIPSDVSSVTLDLKGLIAGIDVSERLRLHNPEFIPKEFALEYNYPNPFNPSTEIVYSIPEETFVQLEVYSISGQKVATLVNTVKSAGRYSLRFDAGNLANGVYLYTIKAGNFQATRKMTLIK